MSWGSGATSSGGGVSSAGVGGGTTGSSVYGQMADTGGTAATDPGGFGINAADQANAGQGPTVEASNLQTYGTSNPTIMDRAVGTLDRFNKGGDASLAQAWKDRGMNANTVGYLYNKANQIAGGSKSAAAAPISTTINYQQPTNPYLEKRRRY